MVKSPRDYDPPNKTPIEEEIFTLLCSLEKDPQGLGEFAKIIKLANQYVQVNVDITQPEQSQFMAHQLCDKCQTNRDGKEWLAQRKEKDLRFRLQMCMLRALSFKINKHISIWLKGLFDTIISCDACYKGFLRIKKEVGSA